MTNNKPKADLCALLLSAAERKALKKAVLSKPKDSAILRAVATLRHVGKNDCIQVETFHKDNKATHENLVLGAETTAARLSEMLDGYAQINLLTVAGDAEFRSSKSGKTVLLGGDKLRAALAVSDATVEIAGNNREKQYILSGKEEFLRYLGISDQNGRIHDKKQSKFRQINRFLEEIRDIRAYLPKDEIAVADLCCGKSYLTFAAYYYLSEILGLRVRMFGADLKADVIAYCEETARALGFEGLSFLCTDICKYTPPVLPHLVISLHACDTATDIVLNKASEWGADVILSTPCCHHELNHSIVCPSLSFVTEHSMLRQKLCDAATDALRLKKLESEGYRTEALELIDPEETPKNILLRAVKRKGFDKDSAEAKKLLEEYLTARDFLLGKKILF
jgi:hypothetical protein